VLSNYDGLLLRVELRSGAVEGMKWIR